MKLLAITAILADVSPPIPWIAIAIVALFILFTITKKEEKEI